MRFSDASGRKVVSTTTAETVGKVNEFVIDPRSRTVVAVLVKKSAGGEMLRWVDIAAFGADAVTVEGVERLVEPADDIAPLAAKERRVLGKRVLDSAGDEIGKVTDVEFDPTSGVITTLDLDHGQVEGARLVGIGSYAVVVNTGKQL